MAYLQGRSRPCWLFNRSTVQFGPAPASVPCTVPEIFTEVLERASDRERGHASQTAQRTLQHRLTEVFQEPQIMLRVHPCDDPVHDLHAAGRTDPAGGALSAGLDRAELHGVPRHFRHVDGVVEGDDAPVT